MFYSFTTSLLNKLFIFKNYFFIKLILYIFRPFYLDNHKYCLINLVTKVDYFFLINKLFNHLKIVLMIATLLLLAQGNNACMKSTFPTAATLFLSKTLFLANVIYLKRFQSIIYFKCDILKEMGHSSNFLNQFYQTTQNLNLPFDLAFFNLSKPFEINFKSYCPNCFSQSSAGLQLAFQAKQSTTKHSCTSNFKYNTMLHSRVIKHYCRYIRVTM